MMRRGFVLPGELRYLIVVYTFGVAIDSVSDDVVEFPRDIRRRSVGEVTTVSEIHTENRVARGKKREINRHIRLAAGMGLNVGVLRTEELTRPITSEVFRFVNVFTPTIVPFSRIPFGVFVGQDGPGRFENSVARIVLTRDEFELLRLATFFSLNHRE